MLWGRFVLPSLNRSYYNRVLTSWDVTLWLHRALSDKWSLVYERAELTDGTLFFPDRLSREFLDDAKRTMGSYFYANQYLNEVIPDRKSVA